VIAGQNIRKLVKDGFVIKKPTIIHSRARARLAAEAKAKGRHSGFGEPVHHPPPPRWPLPQAARAGRSPHPRSGARH
jgi:hypothetical protein